jgi:hypothetical protein
MNTIDYLRQYRVGQFAILDFTAAFIGIYLISPLIIRLFKLVGIKFQISNLMWLTIPISIIFHILFSTNTPLTKMFLDPSGYYLLKIAVTLMVYMGFKGVIY